MRGFNIRLTHLLKLESTHCGYDELVDKTIHYRIAFEKWIDDEVERLKIEAFDRGVATGFKGRNP